MGFYYAQKFEIVRKKYSVLLSVWRGMCEVLGHVCGCVLGEGKWMQPPEKQHCKDSISEPHLHTFHALFCALKVGLIVQVYPEIRMFL